MQQKFLFYKLVVYVPYSALTGLKQALFDAGAGRQGNYDQCSWQVLGEGQFRPLKDSTPHIGTLNKVETLQEWRLEMRVAASRLDKVVKALKQAHPYEEPAFDLFACVDVESVG